MVLPSLTYDGHTRIGAEVLVYANLGVGILKKQLGFGSSVDITSCVAGEECPVGSFDVTVINKPNIGAVGVIPALAPIYSAAEGEQAPTVSGDSADVICLPNPDGDFLICYDQGITATPGETFRAVGRKYNPVDHTVRIRGEQSLSITDMLVSNWDGVRRINGRRCTIIVKIFPAGGGNISEIQYYTNVVLNVPTINTGSDVDASVELQASGNYSFCAIFSAPKP